MENAIGEYIGFCDSDDWVSEEYIEKILSVLKKNDVDVVCFDYRRIQEWDGKISVNSSSRLKSGMNKGEDCKSAKETYMCPGGISPNRWSKVMRREMAIDTLKLYDNRVAIGEDIMFTAPIINRMNSMYYINEPLINYNINTKSMTQNFNQRYIKDFDLLFKSLENSLIDNKRMLAYINYINMRTMVNAIGKSSMSKKINYLKNILKDNEYHERLKLVVVEDLRKQDKCFLFIMKKKLSGILLLIAFFYRKVKK